MMNNQKPGPTREEVEDIRTSPLGKFWVLGCMGRPVSFGDVCAALLRARDEVRGMGKLIEAERKEYARLCRRAGILEAALKPGSN